MREIKFRAWGKSERMIPWSELCGLHASTIFQCVEGYHLMQYTGLKDSHGTEIYAEDILSVTEVDEDSAFGREETDIVRVAWVDEIAQWRAVYGTGRRMELYFSVSLPTIVDCRVIGNIWENPELIKS